MKVDDERAGELNGCRYLLKEGNVLEECGASRSRGKRVLHVPNWTSCRTSHQTRVPLASVQVNGL